MKSTNYYKRVLSIVALLLTALLLFTACDPGNGGDDGTEAPDVTTGNDGGSTDPDDGSTEKPGTEGGGNVSPDPSGTTEETPGSTDSDPSGTTGSQSGTVDPAVTTGGSGGSGNPGSSSGGGSGTGSSGNPGGSETTAEVLYNVTVVDAGGAPLKEIIIVTVFKGSEQIAMASTGKNGVASFKLAAGDYTFTLKATDDDKDYVYDESECVLSATTLNVSVTFAEVVTGDANKKTIYANDKAYEAAYVGEGSVQVSLTANDMTYFLFAPTRAGMFKFSASSTTATVDIGYYGGTHFVQSNKAVEMVGDYFQINVRASSIGATFVIGLKATNGAAADATLKIERIGDAETDSADAPWNAVQADDQYLVKYTGNVNGVLTDIDITDSSVKIVKGSDGYYHFGSESGPVVMLRIDSASPYIASFVEICSTSPLAAYYYDADGNFVKKEHYNDLIASYAEYVNSDGVVPLNDQLLSMVKVVGEHMGWWEESAGNYLFDEDANGNPINEVKNIAYLFACCYYK